VTTALVGFASIEEVRQALGAVQSFRGVPEAEIRRIKASIKEAFLELCTGCQYCDHCPEGIPVPKMMDAFNHWKLQGQAKAASERLKLHWGLSPSDAERCTAGGQCEEACTQHLPIIRRLEQLASLPK